MIDEVLWARLLGLHLGHAATAHATVVATFLLGLGIGYAWLGQGADRLARPLRRYASLEIGIGLWCLGFPHALSVAMNSPLAAAPAWRVLVAAALLLPPTIAMGGTLPTLIRPLGTGPAAGGRALATLYGLNSLGAVAGGLLAGFYLLERWGIATSLAFAGVGSVLVGLGALLVERVTPSTPTLPGSPSPAHAQAANQRRRAVIEPQARRRALVAGLVAALSGLAALLMQTLWFRVFGVVLGSSAYVFALVITAIIAGITGGAVVARMLLRDRPNAPGDVRPTWLVAATLIAAALLLLVSPAHERLPWWLAHLRFAIQPATFGSWQLARLGLIAGVIIVPAVAMGVVLPLCGRLAMRQGHVASAAANVFAWNTAGSVAGAALGGTVLVPLVGLHGALVAAVGSLLTASGIALLALPTDSLAQAPAARASSSESSVSGTAAVSRRALSIAWLAVAAWAALDPGPWDVRLLSAGAFRRKVAAVPTWASWRARLQREDVVFSADGPDATVAVLERDGDRVLKVNGKPDASSRGDMLTQVASAWVPAVLAKQADRILVIGLGSGVTAGAASRLAKGGGGVEVVEIAPAVVDAARHFSRWNHGVVDNPNVAIHVDDARAWLTRTDARWDVIISEPSNPWVAGNGALFTREFFQLARRRLAPGGVMAQWFHAYEMDDELLRLVLRTVADSFSYVSLWTLFPGDLLLIATEHPQDQVPATAHARLARGAADLAAVELHDLAGLLSLQALSPAKLRARFADGGEVHVDDKPLLELRAPRALFHGGRATAVSDADQRRGWPPAHGTSLAAASPTALSGLPLSTLRGLVRLHVRFASAPATFRHSLLAELARRETDVAALRAVVFTYGRQGPPTDARVARDRLLTLAPTDPTALFAAARVSKRLGEDGRRYLRRCVALGDDPRGRCRRALRRE